LWGTVADRHNERLGEQPAPVERNVQAANGAKDNSEGQVHVLEYRLAQHQVVELHVA
jgi:hypothetical protein